MPSDVEFRILNFILDSWEFKTSPVEHPCAKGFLFGYISEVKEEKDSYNSVLEAAQADSLVRVRAFIEKELPRHLAIYAHSEGVLEVLFSIRQYLGLEKFLASDIAKKLAYAEKYEVKNFKVFLIRELGFIQYRLSKRCYSKRWAVLRDKEIAFLRKVA